jgi:hypothetical protein
MPIPQSIVIAALASSIALAMAAPATPPPRSPDVPPASPPASQPSTPTISATHNDPATQPDRSPKGFLTPIPSTGVPPIYDKMYELTAEQLAVQAKTRAYARQINAIKYKHFGKVKVEAIRQQGIEQLGEFTDPASFKPMITELVREADDVRLAMLDHFARQGDEGQAALGWVAIFDRDAAIRNEALKRMVAPAGEPVKYLLNGALRTKDHDTICAAATVAGALNVVSTIPLLIFAQAATNTPPAEGQGDLAWIAIQTQRAYVQDLVPVVGDNSGAFQPVIGIVSEGVVMRVVDAVVIEYRTPVHDSLVSITSGDWGKPTEYLSYNIQAWWDWFNNEYVPFKNEQAQKDALAGS